MKNPLIDLFYKSEDYFFRSLSKECLDFDDLTTAYLTGVNLESDNPIYLRKNIDKSDELLNRCKIFYATHNLPWNVIVTEQFVTSDLLPSLSNIGFTLNGKSVAMFLELNEKSIIQINDNMAISLVSDKLDQWLVPLCGAFELTHEIMKQYADAQQRALIKKAHFQHFTLFKDEKPIASLTLSLQANIARISDVGTLPAYQNKGYATSLLKHALNEAIDLGASCCFLESSEVGIPVYQKLGFKPLFRNYTYSYLK